MRSFCDSELAVLRTHRFSISRYSASKESRKYCVEISYAKFISGKYKIQVKFVSKKNGHTSDIQYYVNLESAILAASRYLMDGVVYV